MLDAPNDCRTLRAASSAVIGSTRARGLGPQLFLGVLFQLQRRHERLFDARSDDHGAVHLEQRRAVAAERLRRGRRQARAC